MPHRVRPLFALLLLAAHLWLPPFAYADPPDQLWVQGIFDDADYDDVVLLVMAMTGIVVSPPVLDMRIGPELYDAPVVDPAVSPAIWCRSLQIRGPPSA